MPTYEYRCQACEHEFEQFQSITAKPLRKCPQCGKLKLKRLIGIGAGVIFKGSGFWQTDYRSEGYKKAAEADKKAASDSSGGSESSAKSESKAESKSESKTESKKPAETSTKTQSPKDTKKSEK